jgi:hypothetical protein
VLGTDAVTYVGGTASFSDKNVGTGKPVTATGLSLTGADAANYTVNTAATTSANIAPRALTATATGVNKVYDGTTTATVTFADNRVAGDVLTVSDTAASFANKNAGTAKPVSVTGISVSGTDAANYTVNPTATTTADITPAPLIIRADDKSRLTNTFNPAFTATGIGFVGGETLATLTGTLVFSTPAIPESPIGQYAITPSGVSSANYSISFQNGTLSISPAAVDTTTTLIYGAIGSIARNTSGGGYDAGSSSGRRSFRLGRTSDGEGPVQISYSDGVSLSIRDGGLRVPAGLSEKPDLRNRR